MLKHKVIGIGAAGNKALAELIENGVIDIGDSYFINSTLKDIPMQYREANVTELKGSYKGCAKERAIANKLMMDNLRSKDVDLDSFISDDDEFVIIVTSLEGGTGSGASIVLARYISEVLNKKVHLFGFAGFEEDARGLKNTVDWFKELSSDYIVEFISNKKFLDECDGNKMRAERKANKEFVNRIRVLIGNTIVESEEQNIDDTDLLKLTTTPGFMEIQTVVINKIKNVKDFNTVLTDAIDHTHSLDTEPSCKRIGVILNINEKTRDFIDWQFEVLRKRFGAPFEFFTHVQNVHEDQYITYVVAGSKMPLDEIEEVYNNYVEQLNRVDRSKDDFFNAKYDTEVSDFDIAKSNVTDDVDDLERKKNDFFSGTQIIKPVKTSNGVAKNARMNKFFEEVDV